MTTIPKQRSSYEQGLGRSRQEAMAERPEAPRKFEIGPPQIGHSDAVC